MFTNNDCLKFYKQVDGKISIISKCLTCGKNNYFTIHEYELNDLLNMKDSKHIA